MTTNNSKIGDRLNTSAGVWGIEAESTTGVPQDGYADPTGEYPKRDNWFQSSVSGAARGIIINDLWLGGSTMGVSFDVPFATSSIYPFNQANTTPSGHSFEIDDTPGNERILIKHHTGAGVELKQDGSVAIASRSHQIQVVGADHELVVSGAGNLTYNGDLNLTVNGDYNVDVGGTYNLRVGANFNHTVNGSHLTEVADIHSTLVRGNQDVKVWGDVFNFYSSEVKFVSKKDIRMISARDFIVNSARHNRFTAQQKFTTSSGANTVISGDDVVVTGATGKIGGANFIYTGKLYTGPDDDNGRKTVFQGNLIGKASEAHTSNFAQYAQSAHRSLMATEALHAIYATSAAIAGSAENAVLATPDSTGEAGAAATAAIAAAAKPYDGYTGMDGIQDFIGESEYENYETPIYSMFWDEDIRYAIYNHEDLDTSHDLAKARSGVDTPYEFSTTRNWWELWNNISPYAVRRVIVDKDNTIENKISKLDQYTHYFKYTPSTAEIRSKLRTLEGAQESKSAPDGQLNGEQCIVSLVTENRLNPKYFLGSPTGTYGVLRRSGASPTPAFGKTLLGNPIDRISKTFLPKNRKSVTRTIVADPIYNPDTQTAPISSSTKLSRSTTISKFFGAPGSKCSIDSVPMLTDRQNLARQWYLHAELMEAVAAVKEFSSYRLQVTEGYYKPATGIREQYDPSVSTRSRYWTEPFKYELGGLQIQKSRNTIPQTISELKHSGRAVVYTLYDAHGKIDFAATYDLALYIRDHLFYEQLSLDYDTTRPDGTMSQQLMVIMPEVTPSFEATYRMYACTYFNRKVYSSNELVHIGET